MTDAWNKFDAAVKNSKSWAEILTATEDYARSLGTEPTVSVDHVVAALLASRMAERNREPA